MFASNAAASGLAAFADRQRRHRANGRLRTGGGGTLRTGWRTGTASARTSAMVPARGALLATERKGLRDADRDACQNAQQTALGRADKQHAIDMGQALEHFEYLLLGRLVEIDQQVAAEHEVIGWLVGQQRRIEQIADLQTHLLKYSLAEAIALVFGGEMPVAKRNILTPKRILAVQRASAFSTDNGLTSMPSTLN